VAEVCRKGGFSDATFYKWHAKFGGMEASDARRLRELEAENAKLMQLLADAHPSLTMAPPSNAASTTRRPTRPSSTVSSIHFGIGGPRFSLASDAYESALRHEAADLLLVKYLG
jgi:putative transposase